MPRRPPLQERLESDKHEQFARCLGMENELMTCYVGVGYPYDEEAAKSLASQEKIKKRAEEWFSRKKQHAWYKRKFEYPV